MFDILVKSFKTTNNCIILATPLIIFFTLLGLYLSYASFAADNPFKLFFAFGTFLIMLSGFLSAWLYMTKKAIAMSENIYLFENDRIKAIFELICSLPKGIGRLLLPITSVIALYIIIYLVMFSLFAFLITKIGELANYWNLMITIGLLVVAFITLLWIPEVVYNKKNTITALYNSICKVFMNFWESLFLYIIILFLLCFSLVIYFQLTMHPIITFFMLITFYYILVYIVVLLFTYYEQTFIKQQ
jgi:hypothetical protein